MQGFIKNNFLIIWLFLVYFNIGIVNFPVYPLIWPRMLLYLTTNHKTELRDFNVELYTKKLKTIISNVFSFFLDVGVC